MLFEQIDIGHKKNFAYLVGDDRTREVAVIDAGFKPCLILERVAALGARVKYILATHGHRDHIGAAPEIKKSTAALLAAYKTIAGVDVPLDDGDEVCVGRVRIKVIHTPGHTEDSVCFLVDARKLITGDTLYIDRLPKGPTLKLRRLFYQSLHERVLKLGDEVEVWPGHDVGTRPSSTIGRERRHNYVLRMSFQDFCDRRWDRKSKRWVVP